MKKLRLFMATLLSLSCILALGVMVHAAEEKVLIEYRMDPDYADTCELYMGGARGSVYTREMESGSKITAFGVWACEKGNPKNNSRKVEMSLLNDISGLTDRGVEKQYQAGQIISVWNGTDAKVDTQSGFMFTYFYAQTTPKIIINVRPEISIAEEPGKKPVTDLELDNAYVFGDGKGKEKNITTMGAARNITREEVCAMIGRILYQNGYYEGFEPENAPQFEDVNAGMWSYKHIAYMAEQGAFEGMNTINPHGNVTRGETAHIIACALHLSEEADLSGFEDMKEGMPYYADVAKMAAAGYMKGDESGYIHSQDNVTRAEIVAMINRIIGRDSSFYKLTTREGKAASAYYVFPDLEEEGAAGAWYYEDMIRAASAYDEDGYMNPEARTTREALDS